VTICTSICPMNTGAMPMNHQGMQMTRETHDGNNQNMPCDRCEDHTKNIAAITSTTSGMSIAAELPVVLFTWQFANQYRDQSHEYSRLLSSTGPPFPVDTITGTVILRT